MTKRKSMGRSEIEELEIAQDAIDRVGLHRIAKWGGFIHQSTIFYDPDAPPEPEEMNRLFGMHSLPTEAFDVRTEVQQAEQFLRDGGLPTEPTAERTLPELINELDYAPTDEEPTIAEIASFGKEILAEEDLWPLIQKAISYGQAIYRRDHFAMVTKKQRRSARHKRGPKHKAAVCEWVAEHPDETKLQLWTLLPTSQPESPNAGKYKLWRHRGEFYVLCPESPPKITRKKKTFFAWVSEAKKK